jgi:hypothetical protein
VEKWESGKVETDFREQRINRAVEKWSSGAVEQMSRGADEQRSRGA